MPTLGIAKQRLADQLGSAATAGEGRQNTLCANLAGALLVGLLANALVGACWLDPAVGLPLARRHQRAALRLRPAVGFGGRSALVLRWTPVRNGRRRHPGEARPRLPDRRPWRVDGGAAPRERL
jgi:hypothetical protein